VENVAFEVSMGGTAAEEAAPLDVQITYSAGGIPADQSARLTIGYFDGRTWTPLPEQIVEQAVSRVSGTLTKAGVYALYRKP
jgi:hypothetical protein